MVRLGCLLLIISLASLCLLVVLPVVPFLSEISLFDSLLKPILCEPDETIEREPYSSPNSEGGTSYSMNVYCIRAREIRRDVTERWQIIGAMSFIVPFLIGLFGLIFGIKRAGPKMVMVGANPSVFGLDASNFKMDMLKTATATKSGKGSLAERLKEIEDARQVGLISSEEYDRLRKEILDDSV